MLILPDTDPEGAGHVGEKVRLAVEGLAIPHAHSSAATVVTISVGSATIVPGSEEGPEQLIRRADTALYQAKRMGRNRLEQAPAVGA